VSLDSQKKEKARHRVIKPVKTIGRQESEHEHHFEADDEYD